MESLKDYFVKPELGLAVVTETWFHSSPEFDRLLNDCRDTHNLIVHYKNRKKKSNSNPGGVAIIHDPSRIRLTEYSVKGRGHELVCSKGRLPNNMRPLFVLAAYVPPKLKAKKCRELMDSISEAILKIKTEHTNPYILMGGDFNHKDISDAIGDYPDVQIITTGAMRGSAILDIYAVNFGDELIEHFNHPSLETVDGLQSDHNFLTYRFRFKHRHQFTWIWYKSRVMFDKAEAVFSAELNTLQWGQATNSQCNNERTESFHRTLREMTGRHFPTVWKRKRSIADAMREHIKKRKAVFYAEGRSITWKRLKAITDGMIRNFGR